MLTNQLPGVLVTLGVVFGGPVVLTFVGFWAAWGIRKVTRLSDTRDATRFAAMTAAELWTERLK